MTAQERFCCQMMHGHCGQMGTRSSQDCCRMGLPPDPAPATSTVSASNTLETVAAAPFAHISLPKTAGARPERLDASPPLPPPATIDILRI